MGKFARSRSATNPRARQRLLSVAEISFVGEVSSAFSPNSNAWDADMRSRGCFGIRDTSQAVRIDTLSADDMSAARLPGEFGTPPIGSLPVSYTTLL